MDLSIIILNYKSVNKTLNCIQSIKTSDLDNMQYEIIVVDNASGDNSQKIITAQYPKIHFIQSGKNLGMGGGNNLGIKQSSGEFILILNPDVIVQRNTIKILFNYIKNNPKTGIVGPKLLNIDKTLQYSCMQFPKFYAPIFSRTILGKLFPKISNYIITQNSYYNSEHKVDCILGACIMIRKNILKKIYGCFDERFFMYCEDIDLCRRVYQINYHVIYYPEAIAIHEHQQASKQNPWYIELFINKLAREHVKSWIKYFIKWKTL